MILENTNRNENKIYCKITYTNLNRQIQRYKNIIIMALIAKIFVKKNFSLILEYNIKLIILLIIILFIFKKGYIFLNLIVIYMLLKFINIH